MISKTLKRKTSLFHRRIISTLYNERRKHLKTDSTLRKSIAHHQQFKQTNNERRSLSRPKKYADLRSFKNIEKFKYFKRDKNACNIRRYRTTDISDPP